MKSMMWMSLAVASLFLLTCSSVESCICMGMHLQRDVCTSNVVIKGKFLRFAKPSQTPNTGRSMPIYTFDVDVQEVFKGGERIRIMNFTTTSTRCTFEMNPCNLNVEYVIAGNIGPGSVELNSCNYIKPWSELSSEQVVGLRGAYAEGCSCEVATKKYIFGKNQCIFDVPGPQGTDQDLTKRCLLNVDGTCSWKPMA
ncbi:metalloproteinase inhibitor 1-like [Ambystoma mexicanum]|uniref:metalloproteinase inhibitor 1-like n=1 Tax=Ambystoma mexicanum TaxID=8296 RepID=UPI0037E97858